ncbi:MAG TPA: hypothetical protein VK465_05785 [Fibrobacteria bacterium]|nr:hypothetical protein [Fibrobacteria bacterium]
MKPKEEKLAGYLLARTAMHRKVEGTVLRNLRAGHETVKQVSDLMPLGRANAKEDIKKAKGEHISLRSMAADQLLKSLISRQRYPRGAKVPENDLFQMIAATGQYAKTGVCTSYASNAATMHAAKLAETKDEHAIVAKATHTTVDHTWAEMMPKGKGENGKPIFHNEDVIMDGWCKENLAILREDGEYARLDNNGKADHLTHQLLLNHETGPEALRTVKKFKSQIEESHALQYEFRKHFKAMVDAGVKPAKDGLWDSMPVFHADFRKQAGKALHQDAKKSSPGKDARNLGADPVSRQAKHASLAEIQAVGVARSLGANIRGAQAEAPRIIAAAKELFPSPKSFLSRIPNIFGD